MWRQWPPSLLNRWGTWGQDVQAVLYLLFFMSEPLLPPSTSSLHALFNVVSLTWFLVVVLHFTAFIFSSLEPLAILVLFVAALFCLVVVLP